MPLFFTGGANAQTLPQLQMPVDCTLDEDCWLVNYVDVDPSPDSHKDFSCGAKTYEGHKGTDIAIRSRIEMEEGVDVLAARTGKVLRLRDGEDDLPKTDAQYDAIRANNRDCGNGVILDHGQGLLTYYCHLKQNSIVVKENERIAAGQKIAQIGQSGFSEFPHLHLTVVWEGGHVDPFTGHLKEDGCGKHKDNLWKPDIQYAPHTVFDGGFSGAIPDFTAIKKGEPKTKTLNTNSIESLVYWAGFYHAEQGDKITLTIKTPSGKVFARRKHTLEQRRKRPSFYYTGRKLNGRILEKGTYTGEIIYEKTGQKPETFIHKIEVE